jgi:lipopolysaccharide export system ATP-binding protein
MSELRATHLKKSFKKRAVVNDVSIAIKRGECVGLLGPNGAGKTTSFYLIVGLQKADAGHIQLNQQDITNLPIHKRAKLGIGYLPQEASIFRKLTVEENLLAILECRDDLKKSDYPKIIEQLLREFHVSHLKTHLGMRLSGGERRRVEIARALASNPDFILLDEPFAGVDPISVLDIKKMITHLCERNIGVLITDHNVRETLDICSRAYILNQGQVLCEGSPKSILANKEARAVYLGENFDL